MSCSPPFMTSQSKPFALAVHGGAGAIPPGTVSAEEEREYHQALSNALRAGHEVLRRGDCSLDAVAAAVIELEDCPLFNAGRGSVLNFDGDVLNDASVMDGSDLTTGGITNVSGVKNPVLLARAVMSSPHVLLSGNGAMAFACTRGLRFESPDYFITEPRRQEWLAALEAASLSSPPKGTGTVGAVAMDQRGNLAAATSTGGMVLKRWGRIGDSPVPGAGTYADNRSAAVSTTGHGEMFLRVVAAYDVCARLRYLGQSLEVAARAVLDEVARLGGQGGLIAIDYHGHVHMDFNSAGMYRGSIDAKGNLQTLIW